MPRLELWRGTITYLRYDLWSELESTGLDPWVLAVDSVWSGAWDTSVKRRATNSVPPLMLMGVQKNESTTACLGGPNTGPTSGESLR